jgi:cytochrome c553
MRLFSDPLRKRLLRLAKIAAVVAVLAAVGGFLFAWSGLYSVAASRGHWAVMKWFLEFAMRNSVERHAFMIDPPPLGDFDLVALGAAHFHTGCAWCHGGPGLGINPVAKQMLPPPPDLSHAARDWEDEELFWIAKNGIKYTGMPSWASQRRDDEVWAVVAFLKRLAEIDAAEYRELALSFVDAGPQGGREIATEEPALEAAIACARCHGAEGRLPHSDLVPVLHGQPVEFLVAALEAYASGARESGIMQPVASDLSPAAMRRVAGFYSGLARPAAPGPELDAAEVEAGRIIAMQGVSDGGIPPCLACHHPDALPIYPRLAGQSARYIENQLRLWRSVETRHTPTAAIMAPIVQRLTDPQIEAVAAYFASLPAESSGETAQ